MWNKNKKIILIICSVVGIIVAGGGIFWVGKKVGDSKRRVPSELTLEQKIERVQDQLAHTRKQLNNETNSDQKAKLEAKIKQLEQDLTNLKNQQNPPTPPTPPTPPQPIPPRNPPGNQISLEVKWNGSTSDNNYWVFTNHDWPSTRKRFNIAVNHPIFNGKKIDYKYPETPFNSPNPIPNFQLSFLKKDASLVNDNVDDGEYFFEADNNKFTLTPLENWPDETPSNGKEEFTVKFTYKSATAYFFETASGEGFNIKLNHPVIRGLSQPLNNSNQYILRRLKSDGDKIAFWPGEFVELVKI